MKSCAVALRGYQFNRHKPLDKYIVDFYCRKLNLVIEVDGASHDHDDAHLSDVNAKPICLDEHGKICIRRNFMDKQLIISSPDILGGTPVFAGTRVPVKNLTDYLQAGDTLSEFLNDFPSVSSEQAIAFLEQAKEALLAKCA